MEFLDESRKKERVSSEQAQLVYDVLVFRGVYIHVHVHKFMPALMNYVVRRYTCTMYVHVRS